MARTVPGLVGAGAGDMFNRELVSSSEAVLASRAFEELCTKAKGDPTLAQLADQLRRRLGSGDDHPKVRATVDKVTEWVAAGRNVLVFCVFTRTQRAVAQAIEDRIKAQRLRGRVAQPPGNNIEPELRDQFRSRDDDPVVLVVRDVCSESIDLDGGRPCLVHHDLPWNPARLRQRWGRVVRAGSGFTAVDRDHIFMPVLDVEVDARLAATLITREAIGNVLLPDGVGLGEREDGAASDGAIPDDILCQLAAPRASLTDNRPRSRTAGRSEQPSGHYVGRSPKDSMCLVEVGVQCP